MEQAESQALRLIACPHPLSIENGRIDRMVPEGATVAEMIRGELGWSTEGLNALVFIDEERIPSAQWESAIPKAGQNLSVRAIPMGGGEGGDQGKTALRIVAMLAVVVAASFVGAIFPPPFNIMVTAALTIAGSLAINALIRAPLRRRPLPIPQQSLKEVA